MTWIKICGITNLEDALTAVEAGADALGFVFYERSPRRVDPETVGEIVRQLPQRVEKVGVFVNRYEDAICEFAEKAGLTMVQFHGDREDPHAADLLVRRRPEIKVLVAVSMLDPVPEASAMMWDPDSVHAYLADTGGGTGKAFDWEKCRKSIEVIKSLSRVVVAGGLDSANVERPLRILQPWGVDVSSGVESQPGKKDPQKVRAFVAAVRAAEKDV
ncbi:MAG TPA: phosphoribosylanthranilate isomerase [Terriglobales bacterium]|jgi:phosphoribosylanthranilate isomerase|nr:phosphoribosylanthranilate isomerase [Terriglobales bacterium]